MQTTLDIDGSLGEGGGQILRTSLALAIITGTPIRVRNIRPQRSKPGLQRQHLAAARAAAEICDGQLAGDALGSPTLEFRPGSVKPGQYVFDIGTAGSTTLLLQTVLPPLLTAVAPSTITLRGGTHNPGAPPFDFLERAFLPLVTRLGPAISCELEQHGFYPTGGGQFWIAIEPVARLRPFDLHERGELRRVDATSLIASLNYDIATRELAVVENELGWPAASHVVRCAQGPGNALVLEVASEHVTEVFTAFGERGKPAEKVAAKAVAECRDYLQSGAPVGECLADQLLLPVALAGGGSYTTTAPSRHWHTNREIIEKFLPVRFTADEQGGVWRVSLENRPI